MTTPTKLTAITLTLAALAPLGAVHAQSTNPNFANTVVSSGGLGTSATYNNPQATLGQPATLLGDGYHVSMVYPSYGKDASGNNTLVTLGTGGAVTVEFSTPITHSAQHWYDQDFIVYGNSFFIAPGVTSTTDMTAETLSGGLYQNGVPSVSVSADGVTFVTVTPSTPYYPTAPEAWAGVSAQNPSGWNDGSLEDFTKPVNPSLSVSSFTGLDVAHAPGSSTVAADTLYAGSAGGAAFSLDGTGLTSIQYVRFTGTGGSSAIDAVSRVGFDPAAAPEPGGSAILLVGAAGLALCGTIRAHKRA